MTLDDIKRLRELAGKATPGPWFVQFGDDLRYQCMTAISPVNKHQGNDGQFDEDHPLIAVTFHQSYPAVNVEGDDCGDADSSYIAAANPSTITALCDLAERALAQDAQISETVDTPEFRAALADYADSYAAIGRGFPLQDGPLLDVINAWQRSVTAKAVADALAKRAAAQPVALDDERGAFEAWALDNAIRTDAGAWEAWQARALLSASSAADYSQPTDIGKSLREYASNPGYSHQDYADTMRQAADECDRFYGGMMNWKATAQAKDKTIIELREQLASSAAGQVKPQDASLYPCGECGKSVKQACDHRPCGYRAAQQQANAALTQPNAAHHDNGGGNG